MKAKGFTLLEVLIAVVIVAMALVALLSTTIHVVSNHQTLLNKTYGIWIADSVMHQTLQHMNQYTQGEVDLGRQSFSWQLSSEAHDDSQLQTLHVEVYHQQSAVTQLQGVVYAKP